MKISQAQKLKNKKLVIDLAVKIFNQKGFKNTTIKEIAIASELSEPSIYNYFPNKESLVFGYFELELQNTIEVLNSKRTFLNLNFSEKIQSFIECQLEVLEKNKNFVEESFKHIFVSSSIHTSQEVLQQKKILTHFFHQHLIKSQNEGEIPKSSLDLFFINLIWDFYIGIICYWINDSSPSYSNTTQLIDKSMQLLQEILKSNIANRMLDIFQFFIRNHLFQGLRNFRE